MNAIKTRQDSDKTVIYNKLKKEVLFLGDDTSLEKPVFAIWEITSKCNLNCVHCSSSDLEGEMTKEECFKVIDKLDDSGIFWVQLSGGEPLLRNDIFEILSYLRKKGIDTEIYTNGTLITKEIAKKLKILDVDNINISLDGLKQSHERIRGRETYEKTVEGIKNCLDENLDAVLTITLMKSCIGDLEKLLEFAIQKGMDKVKIIDLMPVGKGDALYKKEMLNKNEMKNVVKILKKYSDRLLIIPEVPIFEFEHICDAARTFFRITPDGNITPCSFFKK
ncbi:MAG: radical SAM protein, partial [Nanoarchaeota archaeon]|nr:radical SAM protein [Nanoarchaeota archaeon]